MSSPFSMKWNRAIFRPLLNQHGFSLIELVMVIIFLGVAFVATIGMMTSSIEKSVDNEILTRAIFLAEGKLEAIRSDKNSLGYQYLINENYSPEQNADDYNGFLREVQITDFGSYKEIKVKVSHQGIKPVYLVTQMTNY